MCALGTTKEGSWSSLHTLIQTHTRLLNKSLLSNLIELVLEEISHEHRLEKLAKKCNSEDVSEMKKVQRRLKRVDGSELSFP